MGAGSRLLPAGVKRQSLLQGVGQRPTIVQALLKRWIFSQRLKRGKKSARYNFSLATNPCELFCLQINVLFTIFSTGWSRFKWESTFFRCYFSFIISVGASVVANYICKWLAVTGGKVGNQHKRQETATLLPFLGDISNRDCVIVLILYATIVSAWSAPLLPHSQNDNRDSTASQSRGRLLPWLSAETALRTRRIDMRDR